MLYCANNDDKLCRSISDLKRYAPLDDVLVCKTAEQASPIYSSSDPLHYTSYGISNTMGMDFRDGVEPYKRFHEISRPGGSMVFTDTDNYTSTYWPILRDSEHKRWLWRPPDMYGLAGISRRHNSGCNMTFADGHGEMIHWKDQRTLDLIKGTIADEVDASNGNADMDYLVRVLVGNRPIQDNSEEGE
jgi:prepilin-type processing-associated H-X9-DG protein